MLKVSLSGLRIRSVFNYAAIMLLVPWLLAAVISEPAVALDQEDNYTLLERLGNESAAELISQLNYEPGSEIHLVAQEPHPANWLMERILADLLTKKGYRVICSATDDSALPIVPSTDEEKSQAGGGLGSAVDNSDDNEDEDGDMSDNADNGDGADEEDDSDNQANTGPKNNNSNNTNTLPNENQSTQAAETATTPLGDFFVTRLPRSGEVLAYRLVDFSVSYPWAKRTWVIGSIKYGRACSARIRADHYTEPGHIYRGEAHADRILLDEFPGWAKPYLEGDGYPFPIVSPETPSIRRILEPVAVGVIISSLVYLFHQNQK